MKKFMKNLLVAVSLLISAHAQANLINLSNGFIAFGDMDPFDHPGIVTVYDGNEQIPKFEVWIAELTRLLGDKPLINSFLIPLPGSGVAFEPFNIEEVFVDHQEIGTNYGVMGFVTDEGLGKGISFANLSWQVWQTEVPSPVPEPSSLALAIVGLALMRLKSKQGSPKAGNNRR